MGRSRAFSTTRSTRPGVQVEAWESDESSPDWSAVEELLERLAETHAVFPTTSASSNWISSYEPGRRLMLESGDRSRWIRVEHVQACWKTFERLGRIRRNDVLEPGRASTFVMALFAQLGGVRRVERGEPYLVLQGSGSRPTPNGRGRTSDR